MLLHVLQCYNVLCINSHPTSTINTTQRTLSVTVHYKAGNALKTQFVFSYLRFILFVNLLNQ